MPNKTDGRNGPQPRVIRSVHQVRQLPVETTAMIIVCLGLLVAYDRSSNAAPGHAG